MVTWSSEIIELSSLYESFKGRFPDLDKEFEKLIISDDANTVLLYSRRCLEVIITDLCENELGRPRKTEPLKGVIDKLNKEEKVPAHIFTSMQNLNSVATFGAHPIEFNPIQVRSALIDLTNVLTWYLENKNIRPDNSTRKKDTEVIPSPADPKILQNIEGTGIREVKKRKKVRRIIWIGSISLNIVFILIVIISLKSVPYTDKDWILITDFENMTGDDVFDQSLNTALEVSVQQSSFVNVFPRSKINETLKRMGKENTESINEDIGIEIAEREGISLILVCNIGQIGNVYSLSAKLVDPGTGKILKTENFQADGKDQVLVSLDNLARKIRRDLGESLKEIKNTIVPLPEATTSSLEALKYMVRAQQAWSRDGKTDEAIDLFNKAIELDPGFALAHAYLGSLYYWLNNREKGEGHFTKALSLLDRLTEKEKLWIQARVEGFRGNYDEAVTKYNIYLRNYPNAPDGWFQLGHSNLMLKNYEKAIRAFEKSLEYYNYKEASAYINLAACYSALGRSPEAVEYYIKGFDINPNLLTVPNLNHEFGFTYVQNGEIQKAMDVFSKMFDGSDGYKARGYRSQALLLMYAGKYNDAIGILHKSILINKTLGNITSELRDHLFLATAYKTRGMTSEFESELKKVTTILEKSPIDPWWYFLYGKMLVRDGKIQKAERILNEISVRIIEGNRSDKAAYDILKGEIELLKGKSAEALELMETAVSMRYDNFILESLAHYYNVTGNPDMAVSKYEEIVHNPNQLGWEAQEYWIKAKYILGKIHEEKGNREQAVKYYQEFLDIWKEADPDLPELIDAKARMINLATTKL